MITSRNERWEGTRVMSAAFAVLLVAVTLLAVPGGARGQNMGDLFRQVNPSVVVIRAKGSDVASSGVTRFVETGSGVLVSADGKVMTAAHVVHSMEEVVVEFLGGEKIPATVLSSEPAADLSLLKLQRVPPGSKVATLADSDTV